MAEHGNCTEGSLRLADGDIDQEGRLEVCVSGVWGSVCDNNFGLNDDGHVVCSELGYQRMIPYIIILILLYLTKVLELYIMTHILVMD